MVSRTTWRYGVMIMIGMVVLLAATVKEDKPQTEKLEKVNPLSQNHRGFSYLNTAKPIFIWNKDQSEIKANDYLKTKIAEQYLEAWKWYNASVYAEDYRGLETYFDKELIRRITSSPRGISHTLSQIDLKHTLTLQHISLDYSIVVISDHLKILSNVKMDDQNVVQQIKDYTCNVSLGLQNGRWKILNWHFTQSAPELNTNNELSTHERELDLEKIKDIRGINYYPANSPWMDFWSSYDPLVTERDLRRVKKLGLNTVRVFLPTRDVGVEEINSRLFANFDHFLEVAETYNLHVVPTLFDFPIGFEASTYPIYYRQLNYLLNSYKDNTTILAWNLKNEPDLDFNYHGKDKVLPWLSFIAQTAKELDSNHPITIGWADGKNAHHIANEVDYISIHHYTSLDKLEAYHTSLKAYGKPIVLEEFGYSSTSSIWNAYTCDEEKQSQKILTSIQAAENLDMSWMLWTLYDFEEAPKEVFGWKPWIRSAQKGFGMITTEGKIKPIIKNIQEHTISD